MAVRADRQQGQAAAAKGDGAGSVSGDLDHGRRLDRGPPSRPPPMLQGGEDGQAGMLAPPANHPARSRATAGSSRLRKLILSEEGDDIVRVRVYGPCQPLTAGGIGRDLEV
jgi:hypothetical protein